MFVVKVEVCFVERQPWKTKRILLKTVEGVDDFDLPAEKDDITLW